ncbi:uncharacterized protein [Acropora muricata]|uniref:uncharacterized protein isoform X2 n=1 Tax=Acropora muricata TaxID=159855 RepID=UPI0034E3A556
MYTTKFFLLLLYIQFSFGGIDDQRRSINDAEEDELLRDLDDVTSMLENTKKREEDVTETFDGKNVNTLRKADQSQISYGKVGCYKDNQVNPQPLPELLADLTEEIDWYDLDRVIQKCATLAKVKDYTVFGMQSLGHCRSGKNAENTYNKDGKSSGCRSGVGGRGENMVFMLNSVSETATTSSVESSYNNLALRIYASDSKTNIPPPTTKITVNLAVSSSSFPIPPECMNYKLLNEADRAEGYSSKYRRALCDKALPKDWYRFAGDAGVKMPDFCVAKLRCGAHAPGWLNRSHPLMVDGIIDAKVCFHWGSNCCLWSTDVRVRNCGKFFVYQLQPLPLCSLRYCGNNRQVPVLTTPNAPTPTCDRWLTRDWYRFTGLAGNRMPDKCVPVQRCGTLAPGWLQGGHPSVHAGVVSRMVCFSWGRDCCTWRSRISVRNCGDFYVYKLQNAPVCKLRYCGVGNSEGTTTAKPTPTTSRTNPAEPTSGLEIDCLPAEMRVHIDRRSLPRWVNPSLLRLDDARCGVTRVTNDEIMLAAPLDSCGTMRRTREDGGVSFQNKVVAEFGDGKNRSFAEFPFRCTYKKVTSLKEMVHLKPLYKQGLAMDSTMNEEDQTLNFTSE